MSELIQQTADTRRGSPAYVQYGRSSLGALAFACCYCRHARQCQLMVRVVPFLLA